MAGTGPGVVEPERWRFTASRSSGEVGGLLLVPQGARWIYVFGHGAGADMHHGFMERASRELFQRGVATFRYNFPYMEAERRRPPNPRGVLEATVRSAVSLVQERLPELKRVAGGKSMGGRMTSQATAREPLPVEGLVFYGFPLHPARKPGIDRAAHLPGVPHPMLFLQGTRDALAEPHLLAQVLPGLPTARLHEVEGADHGFHVLKRSGRTEDDVHAELADSVVAWLDTLERAS